MKRFILIISLLAMVPVLAFGLPSDPKCTAPIYPMTTGDEVVNAPVGPVAPQGSVLDETDDIFTIGTTWYENQHNGTCGRMNTTETSGWRQFAWMKGELSGLTGPRHIWWNGVDPNGVWVFPGTGVAVESSIKGGFCNMDVGSNGAGFPGYHELWSGSPTLPWASASMDLIPHSGAFLDFPTPAAPVAQVIWPRLQIGQNQRIHMFCSNQVAVAANPQRMWYMSGTYDAVNLTLTWVPTWTQVDWTQTIAYDVAVSPVTGNNKTLWAWTRSMSYPAVGEPDPNLTYPQLNNDIYYLIDSDGLNPNFAQKVNLTHFIPPNLSYLPDTLRADQDTLRAYTCMSTFIDHNNYAHIAFTTRSYFALENTSYWNASIIWHWSEQYPDSFKMIANFFGNPSDTRYWAYCGAWNVRAQRPSLGEDAAGHLYCMYQVYDTDSLHLSNTVLPNGNGVGAPSGEIYMSVSLDGGLSWAQGTNVTNTITPYHALAGNCRSELTPTMAKKVDTYAHIQYVYDLDAGNVVQTEGAWTNNNVVYNRVPVSSIATTPLLPQNKFLHIGAPPTATLDVNLTPINPPITIPAIGGNFNFNISITRLIGPMAPYAVWTRAKNPNGTYTGNLLGPVTVNTPVGVTISRQRTQTVPGTWAPGVYTYLGYVNNAFGYPAIDSSWFTFTKLATGTDGPLVWDANCYGELFPGEVLATTPTDFAVEGCYPNPFNPTTTISFTLPEASHVNLTVFDVNGRAVATLVNGQRDAGRHQVTFDGAELSSGVYFYTLTSGANVVTGKMALVK